MPISSVLHNSYGRSIELGLAALLQSFDRSIGKIRFIHDVMRDSDRCDAIINLPWGEQIQVGSELWTSTIAEHSTHDIIEWYVFSMAKRILVEEDIKEEVADGRLPPEALDTLEGIYNVVNTLVIQ